MVRSKYEEIKLDLIKKIVAKELRPGDKVPSESDLKAKYEVSSTTVVKALNELVSEGYIYRVQGKGSFVSKALRGTTVKFYENDYKFYDRSNEHTQVISVDENPFSEIVGEFEDDVNVREIVRLKYDGKIPIQVTITYIDSHYIIGATTEELKSIYSAVKVKKNINLYDANFKEDFSVLYPAPKKICELLGITEETPVIYIKQKTFSNENKLIESIESYKRYDYFNITITST